MVTPMLTASIGLITQSVVYVLNIYTMCYSNYYESTIVASLFF